MQGYKSYYLGQLCLHLLPLNYIFTTQLPSIGLFLLQRVVPGICQGTSAITLGVVWLSDLLSVCMHREGAWGGWEVGRGRGNRKYEE